MEVTDIPSKHLVFNPEPSTGLVIVFSKSTSSRLGAIEWYRPWRQYVFSPEENTIYSSDCLHTIQQALILLNKKRKEEKHGTPGMAHGPS